MSTLVIVGILGVVTIIAVASILKRIAWGCCGGGGKARTVRVEDKDASHYPYRWLMGIRGMTCGDCAMRIAWTLDGIDGIWAEVDWKRGEADIRGKKHVDELSLRLCVENLGYTVTSLCRSDRKESCFSCARS